MAKRIQLIVGVAAALAGSAARAQTCPAVPPACDDPTAIKNPIYLLTGDTQVPVVHRVGKLLRAQASPITIVYIPTGSCANIAGIYTNKFTAAAGAGPYYIPDDANFDVTVKTACPCTQVNVVPPDVANTIIFPDAKDCPTAPARPADIGLFRGPVQAMVFVAPYDAVTHAGSTQQAITAEEAYLVLGLGAENAQVPPWNDRNYVYGRPASKGTQVSIGENIGVPAAKWKLLTDKSHTIDQSSDLAAAIAGLSGDPNAEKALGILGVEIYDKSTNRAKMRSLAYRAYQQLHAYWPDRSPTSFDKQNVRDGHYLLWSYVQYLTPVDNTGKATKPAVQTLIDMMVGNPTTLTSSGGTPDIPAEPLDSLVTSGLVPICAMGVQRSIEGGPLSLYSDAQPCACYFDAKTPGGATTCATCDTTHPCATGMCRRGYCEAR